MRARTSSITLLLLVALAGCTAKPAGGAAQPTAGVGGAASSAAAATPSGSPGPTATPSASAAAPHAPSSAFGVGVRTLNLKRGNRSLPTTVWYPAAGRGGSGAAAAAGRFPVVEFSHGLHGLPEYYQSLTSAWAAAGFVVAAPAFPDTNAKARTFDPADMLNQPADAWYVLTQVLALDTRTGDVLAGHLDTAHLAAAGHSAGGFTTAGMFGSKHDPRLKAGIVIAGGAMGTFGGPAASMLFIHGDKDPVVPIGVGQAAYRSVKWPKAFITMVGQGHVEYLSPRAKGFSQLVKATTDLLRATLYADPTAKRRISADAAPASTCRIDNHL